MLSVYQQTDELNRDVAQLADLREDAAGSRDRVEAAYRFQEEMRGRMNVLKTSLRAAAEVLGAPIDDD